MHRKVKFKKVLILFILVMFGIMVTYLNNNTYASDTALDGFLEKGKALISSGDYKAGVQNLAMAVLKSDSGVMKDKYRMKTLAVLQEFTDQMLNSDDENEYDRARDIVVNALEHDFYKTSEMLHNQMGSIYRKHGKIKEAAAEYEKALSLNPDYFPSRFNLALCFFKLQQFQKSYQELDKIPESSPIYKLAKEKKDLLIKHFRVSKV